MSSSSSNHRKGLDKPSFDRNQFMTKRHDSNSATNEKSENNESMSTVKKPDASVSTNAHRKFDASKHQNVDGQDKGSDESYVREYKEFAGVTIIIRTIVNPRAFASLDPNSKSNILAMRRKSDLSQSQANTQDKVEHTEKADHAGTNTPTVTSKSDTSSNNSHDSAAGDKQH
ncbi:unnamed protein product [Rotaria socialis]|uniref:Uncharacterized protein n=1 Tax=Rotaria socialis TaxID=392032 RepID=A0A820HQU6_9BILA|nr:unnamed protein product [Rotaria socialis]CAF4297087.1 unnamed protein product [Rotaria socialis]